MTSTFFKDLYTEAESGVSQASVPAGKYDVVVSRTGTKSDSSMLFLTLQVLNGPAAGKESEVGLWFPTEAAKRGARIFFTRKIAGFIAYPDVKAAFAAADGAPDADSAFKLIAQTLEGKQVTAELGMRSEGEYAGSNELKSTGTIEGSMGAPVAPAAVQQVQVPAEATAPATPNGVKAPF